MNSIKKTKLEQAIKIFWIFIIGCIIGYVIEMIVVLVQTGKFESRQGLIYGPFAQVYGIGLVTYYLVLKNQKDLKIIFLITFILGGSVEYICSYLQEKYFGTVSWDYSNLLFDINGRTSLLHCTYWGVGGIVFTKYVRLLIDKLDNYINNINFKYVTMVLTIFMLFNITISTLAAVRQLERRKNISAVGTIDHFLDRYYSDEYMNKVYANKMSRVINE